MVQPHTPRRRRRRPRRNPPEVIEPRDEPAKKPESETHQKISHALPLHKTPSATTATQERLDTVDHSGCNFDISRFTEEFNGRTLLDSGGRYSYASISPQGDMIRKRATLKRPIRLDRKTDPVQEDPLDARFYNHVIAGPEFGFLDSFSSPIVSSRNPQ
jgi:hypothetical protein